MVTLSLNKQAAHSISNWKQSGCGLPRVGCEYGCLAFDDGSWGGTQQEFHAVAFTSTKATSRLADELAKLKHWQIRRLWGTAFILLAIGDRTNQRIDAFRSGDVKPDTCFHISTTCFTSPKRDFQNIFRLRQAG